MKWRHAASLLLLMMLAACGADGGSRGTGIEALVQGNVDEVQTAALPRSAHAEPLGLVTALRELFRFERAASAGTTIEGIRVVVEGTTAQGETDANGSFSVRGDFDGRVRLLFQRAEDGIAAELPINIPGGGTLTLNNVQIDNVRGEAVPESQDVDFEGIITGIECAAQTLTLRSLVGNDQDRYILRLDTSSLHDAQGNTLACADLRDGQQATVQGAVNPDGSFGDAVVEVQ